MRKQGVWVTRFVFLALFVFVVLFMGYHVVDAVRDPVGTVAAVLYRTEHTISAVGLFVRDEETLSRPDGIAEVLTDEGARVGIGEPVAVVYRDTDALTTGAEVRELKARIGQLESIQRQSADLTDTSGLDSLIDKSLTSVLTTLDRRDCAELEDKVIHFKSLLFKRESVYGDAPDMDTLLEALRLELQQKSARVSEYLSDVSFRTPGTFSPITDGFETLLTPDLLQTLNAQQWDVLYKTRPQDNSSSYIGKISKGFVWYFTTVLPAQDVSFLEPGHSVSLRLPRLGGKVLRARVSRMTEPGDGKTLVVFEGNTNLADLVSSRHETAEMILESYEGIRIPKDATRISDGVLGVYCQVLSQARFKPVEILLDRDNYYIVTYDPTKKNALLPGDEVITRGRDLFDGKILR